MPKTRKQVTLSAATIESIESYGRAIGLTRADGAVNLSATIESMAASIASATPTIRNGREIIVELADWVERVSAYLTDDPMSSDRPHVTDGGRRNHL